MNIDLLKDLIGSRLAKSTGWTFLIGVGSSALGFLVTLLLARNLGPSGYGIYAFAFSLVAMLALPTQAGLPTLVTRETARGIVGGEPGRARGVWLWARRVVGVLAALVSVATLFILLATSGTRDAEWWTILWALALIPLMALTRLRGASLRGLDHPALGEVPVIVRPTAFLVLIGAWWFLNRQLSAPLVMALHVSAAALALIVAVWLHRNRMPEEIRNVLPIYERRAWRRSVLPLALISGMMTVTGYADVVMIGAFLPAHEVGVYRVAVVLAGLTSFGLQTVNIVISPRFASLHQAKDSVGLQRLVTGGSRAALAFSLLVSLFLVALGQFALAWLFGEEYLSAYWPIVILLVGHLANSVAGSVGSLLTMTGNEKLLARALGASAVVNVLINFALIPVWGIEGAAVATAVSFLLWNVWLYRSVRSRLGINTLAFGSSAVLRNG